MDKSACVKQRSTRSLGIAAVVFAVALISWLYVISPLYSAWLHPLTQAMKDRYIWDFWNDVFADTLRALPIALLCIAGAALLWRLNRTPCKPRIRGGRLALIIMLCALALTFLLFPSLSLWILHIVFLIPLPSAIVSALLSDASRLWICGCHVLWLTYASLRVASSPTLSADAAQTRQKELLCDARNAKTLVVNTVHAKLPSLCRVAIVAGALFCVTWLYVVTLYSAWLHPLTQAMKDRYIWDYWNDIFADTLRALPIALLCIAGAVLLWRLNRTPCKPLGRGLRAALIALFGVLALTFLLFPALSLWILHIVFLIPLPSALVSALLSDASRLWICGCQILWLTYGLLRVASSPTLSADQVRNGLDADTDMP